MPFQIECPQCRRPFSVHEPWRGLSLPCPECRAPVTVPEAASPREHQEAPPVQWPAPAASAVPSVRIRQPVRRRKPAAPGLPVIVGSIAAVAIVGVGILALISSDGGLLETSPERHAVLAWIRENADDPNIEIIKWEGPKRWPQQAAQFPNARFMRIKYRMPMGELGSFAHDDYFVIEGGKARRLSKIGGWGEALMLNWEELPEAR